MAALSVMELPEGEEWLYELKLDGSPYSSIVIDSRMSVVCPQTGVGHNPTIAHITQLTTLRTVSIDSDSHQGCRQSVKGVGG